MQSDIDTQTNWNRVCIHVMENFEEAESWTNNPPVITDSINTLHLPPDIIYLVIS